MASRIVRILNNDREVEPVDGLGPLRDGDALYLESGADDAVKADQKLRDLTRNPATCESGSPK